MRSSTLIALLLALGTTLACPGFVGATDLQTSIQRVEARALPALVNIQPVTESYTRGERRKHASVGSGFLIDPEGHIVTNYHVAGKASQLMVTLSNKERIEAELVGGDPLTDLAVIRIPKEAVTDYGLTPLQFGNSAQLRAGAFVLALGSPLDLARTLTFGIVSNTERYLREGMTLPTGERTGEFNTWIQTDAAINPGNSGGPLVNLDGQVVGVNARGAVLADNIGFAIPATTARQVVADLIATGEVTRSYIGVRFQPLRDWEELFGMEEPRGVLISSVEQGAPGETAGLQAGDILLSYGGSPLLVRFEEELPSLYQRISETKVGSSVALRVLRRGQSEELDLEVSTVSTGKLSGERFEAEAWGFTVKEITDQMVFDLDLVSGDGVLVEGVLTGGPAHRGRLGRGVVIESLAGEVVTDLESFKSRYEELKGTKPGAVLLQVRAYESLRYVLLQMTSDSAPTGELP